MPPTAVPLAATLLSLLAKATMVVVRLDAMPAAILIAAVAASLIMLQRSTSRIENERRVVLDEARAESDRLRKESRSETHEWIKQQRDDFQSELKESREETKNTERELRKREDGLERRMDLLGKKEKNLGSLEIDLENQKKDAEKKEPAEAALFQKLDNELLQKIAVHAGQIPSFAKILIILIFL